MKVWEVLSFLGKFNSKLLKLIDICFLSNWCGNHTSNFDPLFKAVWCSLRLCISKPYCSGFEQISTLFSYISHWLVQDEIWSILFLKISKNLPCNMDNIKDGHGVGINVYGGQTKFEMVIYVLKSACVELWCTKLFWYIGIFINICLLQSLHFSVISIDLHFFGKGSHSPFNWWVDKWL